MEEDGEFGYVLQRCKFKGCDRQVFCEHNLSFMHNYCCRTHTRMDGALEAPQGDRGVGQAGPITPNVEHDVNYVNWFQGVPGALVRKEEAREEHWHYKSGHALMHRKL